MKEFESPVSGKETGNIPDVPEKKESVTATGGNRLNVYASRAGVNETVNRIRQTLDRLDIPVFALFDHGKNALDAGLALPPTQVIVFGSPAVGTRLMQENPAIAIELPLKIAVWEDRQGNVWVAFPRMCGLAADYGMEDNPVISNMQNLLEKIVRESLPVD
ncbi:MAG: DUF302 domain-containing protein [Parabacteroides sp.]|nr:DUF302 domain-containing protein [Parabacteroides sp.]